MYNKFQVFFIGLLFTSQFSYSQTQTFTNPIIPGAYPDPSICRVGDDYYLSNSSFEYFPGIPIWHSKDLVHWEHASFGIHRPEQFNFDGLASSAGAWAGTIRYNQGTFYLPLTWVDWRLKVGFKNVILTAKSPAGPWSDPYTITDTIWGIDPALFFDNDGKAYWLMNHPAVGFSHPGAASIMIQEINLSMMKLVGSPVFIGRGAMLDSRYPEGPKLFKKDGYYYLLIAEGGTGQFHAVTISRSKNIFGPYENYEGNPLLTHRAMGYTTPFVNIGHADMVSTDDGAWWMVCLGSRPLAGKDNILGRETFLTPVKWSEGQWPVVSPEYGQVRAVEASPALPAAAVIPTPERDDFENSSLSYLWAHIRTPAKGSFSLTNQRGFLKLQLLTAKLSKPESPAFIGQRLRFRNGEASTSMSFKPQKVNDEAGLVLYKSEMAFVKFVVTKTDKGQCLQIITQQDSTQSLIYNVPLKSSKAVELKIIQQENRFAFFYKVDNQSWTGALPSFDGHILSVERAGGFMGVFVGVYAGSVVKSTNYALFDWFEYKELD